MRAETVVENFVIAVQQAALLVNSRAIGSFEGEGRGEKKRVDNLGEFTFAWGGETVVHGLFREEKRRVVSCEARNYGKLVLFDRSESVYFIDKLEVLTFPLGDTKDFPTGE